MLIPKFSRWILGLSLLCLMCAFKVSGIWVPELPELSFNYANIALPNHLNSPPIQDQDNTPLDNPITDAGATLGRVLFYDKDLSLNSTIACATCHLQAYAFTDTAALSTGFDGGLTGRNSMGLSNARFYTNGRFFWDERSQSLEHQVLQPIQDPVEMGMTLDSILVRVGTKTYYPELFVDAFGDDSITSDRISRALAQFVRSMVSFNSKFDTGRTMLAPGPIPDTLPNFTAQENEGMNVFFDPARGACISCHTTDNFVQATARNNGLELIVVDSGLYHVTGNLADVGKFKAPSLRNIELTAPYMHDGRLATLEEVVEHYDSGVQATPTLAPQLREPGPGGGPPLPNAQPRRLNLTEDEKAALVAFLKTLTDPVFTSDPRWSDPYVEVDNVAIYPAETSIDWKVYPNPADKLLTIELPEAVAATPYSLRLINLKGQLSAQTVFQGGWQQTLDVQSLTPGIYVLQLIPERGFPVSRKVHISH